MFDISPDKLLVVLVVGSLVLGPQRLHHAARSLARARHELRRVTGGLDPATQKLLRSPKTALLDALSEQFPTSDNPSDSP